MPQFGGLKRIMDNTKGPFTFVNKRRYCTQVYQVYQRRMLSNPIGNFGGPHDDPALGVNCV